MSFGAGGCCGDPNGNGQKSRYLVRQTASNRNYGVPPDNPFIGGSGLSDIWAYGLRNPWRFSFDRITGDLFVADVEKRVTSNFKAFTFTAIIAPDVSGARSRKMTAHGAVKNCSPLASTSARLEKTR